MMGNNIKEGKKIINESYQSKNEDNKNKMSKIQRLAQLIIKNDIKLPQNKSFLQIISQPHINFGLGAMFGAFQGDSLGSYCEFRKQPQWNIQTVMKMPGKGTFNVLPGQFTDDSQLASKLLNGLLSGYEPEKQFKQQQYKIIKSVALNYLQWLDSQPFDIGLTTRNALSCIKKNKRFLMNAGLQEQIQHVLKNIFKQIDYYNKNSQSNGSLMRITPMAYFIGLLLHKNKQSSQSCIEYKQFIMNEIRLTHSNQIILQAGYAWVQLLVKLMLRKKQQKTLKQIYEQFYSSYRQSILNQWMQVVEKSQTMDGNQMMGWAKIAFTYGINHFKQLAYTENIEQKLSQFSTQQNQQNLPQIFINILSQVIKNQGDTDTNGAIVGGLMGVILGFEKLPEKYLVKQFELRLDGGINCERRNKDYQPRLQYQRAVKMMGKFEGYGVK